MRVRVVLLAGLLLGLAACSDETENADWVRSSSPSKVPDMPLPEPTPGQQYIGPLDVEPYLLDFLADAESEGADVSAGLVSPTLVIQHATLDAYGVNVIGLCETGGGKRRVTFDPDYWDGASETQRKLLAHHEFGHCVLRRGHRSELLPSGKYASIMYPIIMSSTTFLGNAAYYIAELFAQTGLSHEEVFGEQAGYWVN